MELAFSNPLGSDGIVRTQGRAAVGRKRESGFAARRRTRVQFEGVPPTPPGGFYDAGEWDEFNNDDDGIAPWNLLALYGKMARINPLGTKMFIGGIITALADATAQILERGDSEDKWELSTLDYRRIAGITSWFTIIGTPLLHTWFGTLERLLPGIIPMKGLKMMLIDQAFFAVFFNFQLLFGISFMETFDAKTSLQAAKDQIRPVILANWKLWPFTQFCNFTFVPIEFRVLFTNVVAFLWTTILSTMSHKDTSKGVTS